MQFEKYTEYAVEQTKKLLAIDSPSGYGYYVTEYLLKEFAALGIPARRTIKGGVIADFGGKKDKNGILLECIKLVPDLALAKTVGIVRQIVGRYIGQEITKNVVEREEIQKLRAVFPICSSDTFEYLLRHILHFSAVCPELVKER